MTIMPGSTVQCVNPRCEVKGNWMRAETLDSESCPLCGEALRPVPPPLMPRLRFRPRPAPPRPPLRPR
jgi:rRNA maturation protein Nop10